MAKPTLSPRILTRLFERTTLPVYLVNSDYVIAYANDACAQWVGLDRESLISASCVFTSQDLNEIQNKVQGLCPPPEIFQRTDRSIGAPRTFSVSAFHGTEKKSWRAATMHPLHDADQTELGVLIICEAEEFNRRSLIDMTDRAVGSFNSEELHTALAQIRTRTDRIYNLESLVGTSPFANRLRRQVTTSIETNADLLIIGPPGSGKEHLSRTIHTARDPTRQSELLPVHCSIADQRLIQQNIKDIVGSRTAFRPDSSVDQQDWLLLLDVDLLGEAAQNELLGFFQLPNFPLRTIATSTASLIELAANGKYSADLAHHLSVLTIELVALSVRQTDIPLLAQALIERDNFRRDRQLSGFSNEVMQQLIEFDWPENIDQLNRTIQVAARNASGTQIIAADLPDEFRHGLKAMRIGTAEKTEIQLDEYLSEIEKELVARALKQAKGNKTQAAKLLGISRPKLLRRLQFFGLGDPDVDPAETDDDELDSSAFEELD